MVKLPITTQYLASFNAKETRNMNIIFIGNTHRKWSYEKPILNCTY